MKGVFEEGGYGGPAYLTQREKSSSCESLRRRRQGGWRSSGESALAEVGRMATLSCEH